MFLDDLVGVDMKGHRPSAPLYGDGALDRPNLPNEYLATPGLRGVEFLSPCSPN